MKEKLTARQRKERNRRVDDLSAVTSTLAGRRFVLDILGDCGIYSTPFAGEAPLTDFNCGRQNAGLALLARLDEVEVTLYPAMLLERAKETRNKGEAPIEEAEDDG